MKDIILLIAGSVLGWYGKDWIKLALNRYWLNKKTSIDKVGFEKICAWLFNYYHVNDDEFYQANLRGNIKKIPFLTRKSWHDRTFEYDSLFTYNSSPCSSPISTKRVERRKKLGYTIWEDNALCVSNIKTIRGNPKIEIQPCSFFQFVSTCGALEDEMVRAIIKNSSKAKLRDQIANSLKSIEDGDLKACGIGIHSIIGFNQDDKLKLILQQRKDNLITGQGKIAGVPCFALTPVKSTTILNDNLIDYNFYKEFYEELYDMEEIIKDNKRIVEDWFYSQHPISTLKSLKESGQLSLTIVGFGIDPQNCEMNICLFAHFKNDDFINKEIVAMKPNWEINDIKVVDFNSGELYQMFSNNQLTAACSFTISRIGDLIFDDPLF